MKRTLAILAFSVTLAMASSSHAYAAPPPAPASAHKSALRDWKWWIGEGVILASTALDAHSTCRNMRYGYLEQTWPLRGSSSCRATVGFIIGGVSVYTAIHLLFHKHVVGRDSLPLDVAGYAEIPAIVAGIHLSAAAHNYSLPVPRLDPAVVARLGVPHE
jgi:hypothetical protein